MLATQMKMGQEEPYSSRYATDDNSMMLIGHLHRRL